MPESRIPRLDPEDTLRVMDAASVLQRQRERLAEHEELDREAAVREIQVIYEGVGDLVDREVIERALDEYLSERHAYRPPGGGLSRSLATLYVRRGTITRRVLVPVVAVASLVGGAMVAVDTIQERAVVREAALVDALTAEALQLRDAIRGVAIEDAARERAEEIYEDAALHLTARDRANLQSAVERLRALDADVRSEYRVVATGGVWRFRNDDPDVRNYYLIVTARDADGRPVRRPVVNEETGRTERVSEWAERVPQDVYDRVAADKRDNGIIDDDAFAVKHRGYLSLERGYPDVGQITRWDP